MVAQRDRRAAYGQANVRYHAAASGASGNRPGRGHSRSSTRASTPSSAIAPPDQESRPSKALSRTTHQPSLERWSSRLTATTPSAKRTTAIAPGRGRAPYLTSSRSPSSSVGVIERPRTTAIPTGISPPEGGTGRPNISAGPPMERVAACAVVSQAGRDRDLHGDASTADSERKEPQC